MPPPSQEERDYRIMLLAVKNKRYSIILLGKDVYLVRGWDYLRRALEREWAKHSKM